jgi:hypothetical protein
MRVLQSNCTYERGDSAIFVVTVECSYNGEAARLPLPLPSSRRTGQWTVLIA